MSKDEIKTLIWHLTLFFTFLLFVTGIFLRIFNLLDSKVIILFSVLLFVILDIWAFFIKSITSSQDRQNKGEKINYSPNLKIWSLGAVLGLSIYLFEFISKDLFKYLTPMGKDLGEWGHIFNFTVLISYFVFFGIILFVIIQILRSED
jgi:hypothetical protein